MNFGNLVPFSPFAAASYDGEGLSPGTHHPAEPINMDQVLKERSDAFPTLQIRAGASPRHTEQLGKITHLHYLLKKGGTTHELIAWTKENGKDFSLTQEDYKCLEFSPKEHLKLLKQARNNLEARISATPETSKFLLNSTSKKAAIKAAQEYHATVSRVSTELLGLKDMGVEQARTVKIILEDKFGDRRPERLETLAHWVNTYKIPLRKLELSKEDIWEMGPHLQYVDIKREWAKEDPLEGWSCEEIGRFIQSCQRARSLFINSPVIKQLNPPIGLHTLDCSGCTALTTLTLSDMAALHKLDCNFCIVLTTLTLSRMAALYKLNLIWCNSLTTLTLSDTTALHTLDCRRCRTLTNIRGELPLCESFNCTDCPQLVEYPQLPPTVVGSTAFYVDPLILEEDPLRILLKLGRDALLRRKRMPNIVWLTPGTNIPAQGVDFGGLRRQLVTTLFHKLMQENSPITFQKDLQLPLLSDFSNQNEIDTYRTIGRLLAICAETSTLTGVHLHSNFFRAILALTKEEIDSISFDHPPSEEIQKKIFCELKGWSVSQWPPGADVLDYLEQEPIVYPVAIVAKEMQKTLGNKLQKWNRKGLKNFITSIQGQEVSITALREHLLFEGGSSSSEYERQIAAYLDSWMVHHSNELADLVELITSRRSLGREKITVEVYEHRKNGVHKGKPMQYFPIAHTCSTSIEIPYCATQEEFDKNIRVALKSRGTFEID